MSVTSNVKQAIVYSRHSKEDLQDGLNKNSSGDETANVNFARMLPEFAEITQNNAITPFKVIQGHRFWYQSKAHIRFPSDQH